MNVDGSRLRGGQRGNLCASFVFARFLSTQSIDPTRTPYEEDDESGSVSSDIIASTRTVKRQEAASTSTGPGETSTSSPPESVAGRQAASNVRVLGLLSVVVTLL
ncbi:unnamed protein product [Fusarium graminearum]|uniref:Chromosome 3, complete genome n=1 Tax=Gibberella zeae (strain ATCC MYA-4620 / CBS 123657 / FGSC 9075 / NRRL 31084 / PH-1) TaxID=229533 RepID=A0A098E460_GIBZE|nr:unnamed protein product [Fusarium graminearum]